MKVPGGKLKTKSKLYKGKPGSISSENVYSARDILQQNKTARWM